MENIAFREATEGDLGPIIAIYNHEVLTNTCTFDTIPYDEKKSEEWFKSRISENGITYPIIVAEKCGEIIGWGRLYPWSTRKGYNRTAETAIYIHKNHRGQRLGQKLLQELISACEPLDIKILIAKITSENQISVKIHEKFGFKIFGTMRRTGIKFDKLIDVHLMDLHLDEISLKDK